CILKARKVTTKGVYRLPHASLLRRGFALQCFSFCLLPRFLPPCARNQMGLFYGGGIDVVSTWHRPGLLHSSPLLNNSLLLLFFCLAHSVLARQSVKRMMSCLVSTSVYRHLYILQSSLSIFLICYGWTPLPSPTLWDIHSPPFRLALYGVGSLGVVINMVAFLSLPVLEFIGISEPLERLTGRKREGGSLVTSGLFSLVRHPMYTSILLCIWSNPTMSLGRMMVGAVLTVYLLVAVPLLEERDLVEMFGDKYRHYITTTPMLLPFKLWTSPSLTEKNKSN
ncbi:Methanethiol S-methyltransferase 1, partial [Geodia barretti]